ncbi:hypothetical protein C804_04060 [Lachnospiraceae bacterium A4]|nr:hypothetical protein C804_04060 [Lachnospiraceae bacterium A4]
MNRLKLKETMDQIHMKEEMQKEIIMKVKRQTDRRAFGKKRLHQAAAAAAAFVLIAGAVIPSQAAIRYFVKDRLENIPKQELEAVNQMVQGQNNAEADSFSREYSKEEIKRMQQMQEAYQNGRFPQQTITFTDSVGQIPDDSLSYDPDTSFLYLPDRTLTDEELLQIIDFNYTRDYAVSQGTAAQEARKEWEEKEEGLKAKVQKEGWITEKEALQAAEVYLQTEFGLSAEGMIADVFLDEPKTGLFIYHVGYQTEDDISIYAYGIDLNAEDGSLVDTSDASIRKDRDLETDNDIDN